MNEEHRERLIVKLKRELGTTILDALADDAVIEIMLNPDGKLWVEKFGVGKYHAGNLLPSQSESIVSTVAAMLGTTVGYDKPCLEGEFPLDLSRFSALAPPVVASACQDDATRSCATTEVPVSGMAFTGAGVPWGVIAAAALAIGLGALGLLMHRRRSRQAP